MTTVANKEWQPNAIAILDPDNQKLPCPVQDQGRHHDRSRPGKLHVCVIESGVTLLIQEKHLKPMSAAQHTRRAA